MYEVANYIIDPPFYTGSPALVMNPAKWKSIPENLQKLMLDAIVQIGPKYKKIADEITDRSFKTLLDKGMKVIKFTGADREWFIKQLYDAAYKEYAGKAPVDGPKMYELFKKK